MSREFPRWALLPKEETRALQFIKKFPSYDGRGIRIAILDTGVDPAAAGLGDGKIVDLVDCTGTGDVALNAVDPLRNQKEGDILLASPSGRRLRVSNAWKNPAGTWKVGMKMAYELWPEDLVKRRKTERRRLWDAAHHKLVSGAQHELNVFMDSSATPPPSDETPGEAPEGEEAAEAKEDQENDNRRLARKDLEDRLECLKELAAAYDDPGPVLEAVVWHDGDHWRSVIAGSEADALGIPVDEQQPVDLSHLKPMTDYRIEKHYEVFSQQDLLSYSVNILDDGNLLSIVTLSGAHGTHVAGICAARHPEEPELNGIAPGAEIVSLKIGDRRVKGMETSQALLRAATAIVESGCQICNMSFGEDGAMGVEDKGAFISILRDEVVRRRNVIFVTSAGNAGPALTTIGAPADSSSLFSVGAYVTPAMQAAEYALLERVPSGPTTWSSRGPTFDGDRGMVCWAPGAAITSVPRYVLKHTQLMNGTSMASPSACGSIALVLSALKQEQVAWTPAAVHKAVHFTAKDVDDPQHVGLLQVDRLHEYLVNHGDKADTNAEWIVQVTPPGRGEPMRGIYLRELADTSALQQLAVNIVPKFKEHETDLYANLDLDLTLSATESWIRVPDFVAVNGGGRQFSVRVDPTLLAPGYHTGEIRGLDRDRPVFSIPVSVCKSEGVGRDKITFKHKTFPGAMHRHYLALPSGVTWAEVSVKCSQNEAPLQYWLHCLQMLPLRRRSKAEESFVLSLVDGEPQKRKMNVSGGMTMELVCTQGWNSIGTGEVEVTLDFHGIAIASGAEHLTLLGGDGPSEVGVCSSLRPETLSPSLTFEWRRTVVVPKDATIRTLPKRDRLADGQSLFALTLNYAIKVGKKTTIKLTSGPQGNLYDNAFSLLGTLTDSRNRLYQFADVYEKEVEIDKGEYTYRLQLVHGSLPLLEKIKSMPLNIDAKLDGPAKGVNVTFVRDHVDAFTLEKPWKFEGVKVQPGQRRAFMIDTQLTGDGLKALYEDAHAGDLLLGRLVLSKDAEKAAITVTYVLPPAPLKEEDTDNIPPESKKLVDLQVEMARKIDTVKERVDYLNSLAQANPRHLPTLIAHLEARRGKDKLPPSGESDLERAADAILDVIDEDDLSRFHGLRHVAETKEAKAEKAKRNLQKEALVAALSAKVDLILASMATEATERTSVDSTASTDSYERLSTTSSRSPGSSLALLDAAYQRLAHWTEAPPHKMIGLKHARRELLHGRPGSALLTILKLLKELGAASTDAQWKEATDLRRDLFRELKWDIWSHYDAKRRLICQPPMGVALF